MVFSSQIGRNLKVYVDDMLIKTRKKVNHVYDFEETFESIRKFYMRLNRNKFTFRVQANKFLGFMLRHRGIEAILDKSQEIINMRSPTSVKEVQWLTERLAAFPNFCLAAAISPYIYLQL